MRISIPHFANTILLFLLMVLLAGCQTTRFDPYARPAPASRYGQQVEAGTQAKPITPAPTSSSADRPDESSRSEPSQRWFSSPPQARHWTDTIANVVLIEAELPSETLLERSTRSSGLLLPGGWVVSTAHGMRDDASIKIHYRGAKHPASVVYQDPALDLALLVFTLTHNGHDLLTDVGRVSFNLSPSLGMQAFCVGYPYLEGVRDDQPSISGGIIGAVQRSLERDNGQLRTGLIQLDAVATLGNSGGPTIDQEGRIIGLTAYIVDTHGIWSGATFLIPAAQVVDFLRRHGIPVEVN